MTDEHRPPQASERRRIDWRRLFEVALQVLTVIALVLALKQLYDSRRQEELLRAQSNQLADVVVQSRSVQVRLSDIAGLISTQSVGIFPDNMDKVIDLINSAKKELRIMVDVAGYGLFSAPEISERYRTALRDARKRLGPDSVTMLVYSDPAYRDSVRGQFKPGDFKQLLVGKKYEHYFHDYEPAAPPPLTEDQFVEFIANRETSRRKDLIQAGLALRGIQSITEIPFFLWLRDSNEGGDPRAIFSLYNIGDNVREVSFATTDGKLLDAVQDIFKQAMARSKPLTLASPLRADPAAAVATVARAH